MEVDINALQEQIEVQVLYVLALSDYAHEEDFVTKLAGCFAEEQTDEQLTLAVNDAFGTEISEDDFAKVMAGICATYIDTLDYTDPATKNNLDLARWAVHAEKAGWGYVWGTSGGVLTKKAFEAQKQQYPEEVGSYEDFIKKNWLEKRTADCSGLIHGYQWLNPETNQVEPGSNGIPAMSADAMYQTAEEKGAVGTEISGLAVWRTGHIGIYLGNGEVVEAKGTEYGMVKTELASGSWTHWLKVPYITYVNEEENDKKN